MREVSNIFIDVVELERRRLLLPRRLMARQEQRHVRRILHRRCDARSDTRIPASR